MVKPYEKPLERFRDAQRLSDCASNLDRFCQSGPNKGKPGPCPKSGGAKITAKSKPAGGHDHEAVKRRVLEVHRLAIDPKTTVESIDKALEGVEHMPGKHLDDLMTRMSINPKLHPTKAKKAAAVRNRIRSRKGTFDRANA